MIEYLALAWLAIGIIGGVVMHRSAPILWEAWPAAAALGPFMLFLALWERADQAKAPPKLLCANWNGSFPCSTCSAVFPSECARKARGLL